MGGASGAAVWGWVGGGGARRAWVAPPVGSKAMNVFSSPASVHGMPASVSVLVRNGGATGVHVAPLLPGLQSAQIRTRAVDEGVRVNVTAGFTMNVVVDSVTGEPV